MKKSLIAAAAVTALFAAQALADTSQEVNIAKTHAGFAAKAGTLQAVHMHLHHAVNCLVGPSGAGFDSTNMNPCAKAGNGAIPDSTDASEKAKLQAAVETAQQGIASTDLASAQKDAQQTVNQLNSAQ